MATNFPGSLDSFTNPSSSSTLDSPSHAAQHANINDAMVAVQTLLGAGSSLTWTAFTPTWAFASGTITPSVAAGRYIVLNELVVVQASLRVSSVTGSGNLQLTVPSAAAMDSTLIPFWSGGYGTALDVNTLAHYAVMPYYGGTTTTFNFRYHGGFICSNTAPFTWAANDEMFCTIIGEKP